LVVNAEFRAVYSRAAVEARRRAGVDHRLDAAADSGDIPEVEIARHGFGGLTDEQLADYAVSAPALNAIAERLNDGDDLLPELGEWFVEAGMLPDDDIPPEYREAAGRGVEKFRRLERETRPKTQNSSGD
jgi:hypothetical protein